MDNLYIVIPAYNEEMNIKPVISEWHDVIVKYGNPENSKLVVIDDGSKDSTYQIMMEYKKEFPFLHPLTKENGGHGATLLYGYNYAIEHLDGDDYIFQTDSDGQTLPSEFGEFWDLRKDYDMVIGSRTRREDGFSRVFVTKVLKLVVKMCFGVTVTDANTPFRLMKVSTLKEHIGLVPDKFNLSNVLISVIYAKNKKAVKFIPITFRPRQGGVNSINLRRISKIGLQAIKDFKEINRVISK